MRVFLTGGTGYVGSAVLDALVRGGHHVDALVRNSEGAARGAGDAAPRPVLGDMLHGGVVARRGGGGRWRRSTPRRSRAPEGGVRPMPRRSTC